MTARSTQQRVVREARTLVQAYVATSHGATTSEKMRGHLCSVVASMPHLFRTVEGVHVLRESCDDIDRHRVA